MIDLIIKKEPCINKLYAMRKLDHASPPKSILEHINRFEENNITHNPRARSPPKPFHQFTPLTDIVDNILNVLLDGELIELPPIIEPKFPNGVPKNFHYE